MEWGSGRMLNVCKHESELILFLYLDHRQNSYSDLEVEATSDALSAVLCYHSQSLYQEPML